MAASRRLETLIERYGPNHLSRYSDEMLDATERRIRQMISKWPDGIYKGESLVDNDGFESNNIPVRAKVTILGDQMTIDLSESSPQVTGFINSSYANTRSAAHAAIMYLAPSDIPKNEGSMRPVTIIAPKGIVVNANPPAPVAMSTNHCAEEIIEAVFRALSESVPEAVNAGFSRRLRYAITAVDPRTKREFIWHFFLARGGGGASSGFDGWSGVGEVNVAGGIRSPSVEVTEERFPLFIKNHEMRPNSGGDGTWRGGLGGICEIVYEGTTEARLNTAGDGTINPPSGLFEGMPGLPHTYSIISNGTERFLKSKEEGLTLYPGDIIRALSAGGGGYGPPEDRDPDARQQDILNGYVT
jgi:N-methylhydantoinase B